MGKNHFIETGKQSFLKIASRFSLWGMFAAFFAYSVLYVASRSFWIDESMLAISIMESGLSPFEPLTAHNQISPWGFVLITRLVSALFGAGDLQFRLPGILVYFTAMGAFFLFLRKRFGVMIAFAFTFVMLSNPLLLRYSTEFKHYVYEFSFSILLLISYLEMREKTPGAVYVYAISAGLSIFFGISIIIIIAAIFTAGMLLRMKLSIKKAFLSGWFYLHLLFFAVFLVWYTVSITPNLKYNLLNYPHIYNVDLDFSKLWNVTHWGKAYNILLSSILEPHGVIFLLSITVAGFLYFADAIDLRSPIITIPVLIYLFVYLLNFAGLYPILLDRHLLFILPVVYLLFAFLVHQLAALAKNQSVKIIISVVLISFSTRILVDNHTRNLFFFQEIKPVLENLQTSDKVFLYFSAQPGYNWYKYSLYKRLPEPVNPDVNPVSSPRISRDEMQSNLEELITKPGAWPAVVQLTTTDKAIIYDRYLADRIISAGQSKVIFSHRSGLQMRTILEETCELTYFESRKGALILDANCVQVISN